MPTIGEACQQLGVTRKTIEKWLKRLEITPTRHPIDWRFYEITAEELQKIKDTRGLMPKMPRIVHRTSPDALRAESERLLDMPVSEYPLIPPRPRAATHTRPLARLHGLDYGNRRADIARWLADGHGVEFGTSRLWRDLPLEKGAALIFAWEHQRRVGFRKGSLNVHKCQRPDCECQTIDGIPEL